MSTACKLNVTPGSISKNRIKAMHAIARTQGWERDDYEDVLYGFAGVRSCKLLSDHQASMFIAQYGRKRGPHIPGRGDGSPAGLLVQRQADEIARLRDKMFGGNPRRLNGMIKHIMGRSVMPQSLRKYQAATVIAILKKMEKQR